MAGYLYRGKSWNSGGKFRGHRVLERVNATTFCDIARCRGVAAWRVTYDQEYVELCPKHTLSTMRNRRLWLADS